MLARIRRYAAALVVVSFLVAAATPAMAIGAIEPAETSTSPALVDILILRPLGLLTLGLSTFVFVIPVAPITLMTRPSEIGIPFEKMVIAPARYVWVDPIGQH